MKILSVTSHAGGGLGNVILNWATHTDNQAIVCLDYANEKARRTCDNNVVWMFDYMSQKHGKLCDMIWEADIVVVHYYDSPFILDFLSKPLPDCRMVAWCHKRFEVPANILAYFDLFIDTSPIQAHGRYIWSVGDMTPFREIKPKPHKGFNIGYVGTVDFKKLHSHFLLMLHHIGLNIPTARFTIIGENKITPLIRYPWILDGHRYKFIGKVDNPADYFADIDIMGYPLRADHFGTCEQVLGEAMSAGVVPVVMANPCEKLIVHHMYNGLVSLDENEYVDNIKLLYDNKELRTELSENAKVFAKELYSTETMISDWNKVFEELMDKPKTSKGGIK